MKKNETTTDILGVENQEGSDNKTFSVYILECSDGTLYCGYTDDVSRRAAVHNSGHGAKYTRSRLPVKVVYSETGLTKTEAQKREYAIKKLTRAEKLKLIGRNEL